MHPIRFADLPSGLVALTSTHRGMVDRTMVGAARAAFADLCAAIAQAGLLGEVASWMSMVPDRPNGADDPGCRYVAGAVFGYAMATGSGHGAQPRVAVAGTLAWQPLAAGPYAVFLHVGPYAELHVTWNAIYQEWLPSAVRTLRDVPPMELMRNDPQTTAPDALETEIWLPVEPA